MRRKARKLDGQSRLAQAVLAIAVEDACLPGLRSKMDRSIQPHRSLSRREEARTFLTNPNAPMLQHWCAILEKNPEAISTETKRRLHVLKELSDGSVYGEGSLPKKETKSENITTE